MRDPKPNSIAALILAGLALVCTLIAVVVAAVTGAFSLPA